MSNRPLNVARPILFWRRLFAVVFSSSLLLPNFGSQTAEAQVTQYCQLSPAAVQKKENLRLSAFRGDPDAQSNYQQLVQQQAQALQECRTRTWPQIQAIWLRLYPCDIRSGAIEQIMDRIVNRGYNQVYLEVFYDGQVLLPATANPTVLAFCNSHLRSRKHRSALCSDSKRSATRFEGLRLDVHHKLWLYLRPASR